MPQAHLIVPGFNGGNPVALAEYALSSGMRGAGRGGRVAGWSGQFAVASPALAQELDDHLEHTFEEGQSAVSEIAEDGPDGRFRLGGVALRYRGGVRFAFDAFSRVRV